MSSIRIIILLRKFWLRAEKTPSASEHLYFSSFQLENLAKECWKYQSKYSSLVLSFCSLSYGF